MLLMLSVSTPKDRTTALVNLDIMETERIVKVRVVFVGENGIEEGTSRSSESS